MTVPEQIDVFMHNVLVGVSQRLMPDADPTSYCIVKNLLHAGLVLDTRFIHNDCLTEWVQAGVRLLMLQRQFLLTSKRK